MTIYECHEPGMLDEIAPVLIVADTPQMAATRYAMNWAPFHQDEDEVTVVVDEGQDEQRVSRKYRVDIVWIPEIQPPELIPDEEEEDASV